MNQLTGLQAKPYLVLCFRMNEWKHLQTDELLPGDIISLKPFENMSEIVVPCDALLLSGSCIGKMDGGKKLQEYI